MNVLQIMGCTSDQYGSMERYLVRKAFWLRKRKGKLWVAYDNIPSSSIFIKDLQQNGAEILQLKCGVFLDFRFFKKFYALIKDNKIDVVHAYFTPTCHYVMFACFFMGLKGRFRSSANLPLTLFQKYNVNSFFSVSFFMFKQRLFARFAKKIICRSNAIKQEFREMGIPLKKLTVASGGTDCNVYRKRPASRQRLRKLLGFENDKFIIGVACRLTPVKNVALLIQAAAILLNTRDDFVVLIAGDGPERGSLQLLAQETSVQQYIRFLGHRSDIPDLLNVFDLFVQPTWSEGMSNSILEAMASEDPVVVSNIAPNKEIFQKASLMQSDIGVMFEAGNEVQLAKKIDQLLQCKKLESLGKNGREVVLSMYGLDARIEKELSIYEH